MTAVEIETRIDEGVDDMAGYPVGTIGLSLGEHIRSIGSAMSLLSCDKPPGTNISFSSSINLPENYNKVIRQMTGTWLWIQSDDHIYPKGTLRALLDREVDVVVPIILRRGPPFVPLIFKDESADGYKPYGYEDLPTEGLVECVMAGSGGMLIRKHVLDAIAEMQGHDRWFEYEAGDQLNEDFVFARKIVAAGFKIWADVEVRMGHVGQFVIWPDIGPDGWRIGFDLGASKDGRRSTFYFNPEDDRPE